MKNMAPPENDTALLQEALDLSSDAVTLYACVRNGEGHVVDFQIVAMNRLAEQLHGIRLADCRLASVSSLHPDIIDSQVWQRALSVAERRRPYKTTLHHTFPLSNRSGWFRQSIKPWGDGIAIAYHDLTDLIHKKQQVKYRELLFQSIMDNTVNGVVGLEAVRDASGEVVDLRYSFINQTALRDTFRTLPVELHDITGKLITDFFPSIRESAAWKVYMNVVNEQRSQRMEHHYNLDGYDAWIDMTVSPLGDGLLISYLETTDEKHMVQQTLEHARLLETILNTSPMGMALFRAERDEQGKILDLRFVMTNMTNARFAGLPPDAMIGRLNLEIFPGAAETGMQANLIKTVETGEPMRFLLNYDADGIDVWAETITLPYDDGVLLLYLDVTELQNERRHLEQMNNELRKSNDNLQQFAYVASHDMQEPLRKIRAFGDLLVSNHAASLNEEGLDLVRRMQTSAARMQTLVHDLLAYSRLTTHRRAFETVDLDKLLRQVLFDLQEVIQQEDAHVEAQPLPPVKGDANQLHQLLFNLISNALKFHAPGSRPVVSVGGQVVKAQDVPGHDSLKSRRQFVRIDVQDNGIGFDPIYQERIFQLFQRLNGRSQYAGTGIGLAICKKIVDNHNGLIQTSSQPGEGATFTVYLPM